MFLFIEQGWLFWPAPNFVGFTLPFLSFLPTFWGFLPTFVCATSVDALLMAQKIRAASAIGATLTYDEI